MRIEPHPIWALNKSTDNWRQIFDSPAYASWVMTYNKNYSRSLRRRGAHSERMLALRHSKKRRAHAPPEHRNSVYDVCRNRNRPRVWHERKWRASGGATNNLPQKCVIMKWVLVSVGQLSSLDLLLYTPLSNSMCLFLLLCAPTVRTNKIVL